MDSLPAQILVYAQKKLFPFVLYATSLIAKHFTIGLDDRVRECATLLKEERLLAKLSQR